MPLCGFFDENTYAASDLFSFSWTASVSPLATNMSVSGLGDLSASSLCDTATVAGLGDLQFILSLLHTNSSLWWFYSLFRVLLLWFRTRILPFSLSRKSPTCFWTIFSMYLDEAFDVSSSAMLHFLHFLDDLVFWTSNSTHSASAIAQHKAVMWKRNTPRRTYRPSGKQANATTITKLLKTSIPAMAKEEWNPTKRL